MNRMDGWSLEKRATLKRMATLFTSIGTIISYGYAVGGVGGYLFGQGKPFTAASGLIIGTLLALAAIRAWKSYLIDVSELNRLDSEKKASRSSPRE